METKINANKIVSLMLTIAMLFSFVTVYTPQEAKAASTTGFYVDGTTIRDANGNAFVMRGVNIPHVWYSTDTEAAIKGAAAKGANAVRLVLGDGEKYTKTSATEMERVINYCIKYKVVPVFEVHDATGSDSTSKLTNAVNYWIEMKSVLKEYEKYVIVNVANEWMGSWNGSGWASGYKTAIKSLRNAGINNLLVIDGPGWGQNAQNCINYCKEVFNADSQGNTMFSIHMYGSAGGNATAVLNNISGVLDNGVPLMIGEFAHTHSDGDVDEAYIMQCCTQKNVGYFGWSWKGNSGGLEYLDIANDWAGNSLTDWGNTLFNSTYGIKNTSTVCSIYSGTGTGGGTGSDVLWTGSEDLNNWKNNVSYAVNILDAAVGGKITVDYTTTGSGAQFQFIAKVGDAWTWTVIPNGNGGEVIDLSSGSTSYTMTLNAEQASIFSTAKELLIQGQNATITKITYTAPGGTTTSSSTPSTSSSTPTTSSSTPNTSSSSTSGGTVSGSTGSEEVIWEGEAALPTWSTKEFSFGTNVATATEGGILTIYADAEAGAQVQIAAKVGADWTWTTLMDEEGNDAFNVGTNGKLQLVLTAEQAETLVNAKELLFKGQNITVTKVTYKGQGNGGETEEIWAGEAALPTWSTKEFSWGTNIPTAAAGGILTIEGDAETGAQVQIAAKVGADWTWTTLADAEGNDAFNVGTNGKLQIVLTEEQAEILRTAKELLFKGQNITVTKVSYTAPAGDTPVVPDSSSVADSSSKVDTSSSIATPESSSVADSSSTTDAPVTGTPALAQNTFTLDGMIGANFDYTIPAGYVSGNYTINAEFTTTEGTTTVAIDKSKTVTVNGSKAYRFTLPVKSCDLTETFSAKLVIKNANGTVVASTSVLQFTVNDYLKAYKYSSDTNLRKLAAALQTYGYYSQQMFNTDATAPVSKPADVSDVKASALVDYRSSVTAFNGSKKVTLDETTLTVEAETAIRFYIKDLNGVNANNLYLNYTVNGETQKVKVKYSSSKGMYYGEIPNIGASKLANMYSAYFVEGSTQVSDTVKYGAYSYIFEVIRYSDDANLKNLARALYKYSVAATNYIG